MKNIDIKTHIDSLPAEHELELSIIETGMIVTEINNEILVIIKDTPEMTSSLKELSSASIKFTFIEKPEFPTINSDFRIKTENGLSVKYDYFFNSESEYEMNLLYEILNQKSISLILYSDIVVKNFGLELDEKECDELSVILQQFNS